MASAPEADLETRLEDKINADDWGSYYWEYANVVTADNGKQYYYENVALSYSIENTNLNTIEDALTYGSTACVYSDDSTDPGNVFHRVSRNWGNSRQNGWRIHRV